MTYNDSQRQLDFLKSDAPKTGFAAHECIIQTTENELDPTKHHDPWPCSRRLSLAIAIQFHEGKQSETNCSGCLSLICHQTPAELCREHATTHVKEPRPRSAQQRVSLRGSWLIKKRSSRCIAPGNPRSRCLAAEFSHISLPLYDL